MRAVLLIIIFIFIFRPVSAYALFFRDTQAAIKGQNPSASFGEVSKIVASMWDALDADSKNVSPNQFLYFLLMSSNQATCISTSLEERILEKCLNGRETKINNYIHIYIQSAFI